MEALTARFQPLLDQWEGLSTRDRNLLTGLGVFFALMFAGFVAWSLLGTLDDQASRVRTAKENLLMIQEMKGEYVAQMQRIQTAEAQMKQYGDQAVSAFVEQIATQEGVGEGLEKVPETGKETIGQFRQTSYKVELKRVPLEGALGFLYSLETSDFPIRVKSATFRTTLVKREKFVDLNLELQAYSVLEEEAG